MGWKDRFTFRDTRYIEAKVADKLLRFYPNRMALLTEARDLSTPVAQAISVLFADQSRDSSSHVKRLKDGGVGGGQMEEITTEAVTKEMAQYRQKQREDAIAQILNTVADERSKLLLGKLWMDSLRDEFPYSKSRSTAEVEEFLYGRPGDESGYTGLDLPMMVELFKGWMQANAKVFGSEGEKMVDLVRKKVVEAAGASSSDLAKTGSTNGADSKSPSSPQSAGDSQPST